MSTSKYKTPTSQQAVREYVLGETAGPKRSENTILLNVQHSNLKQTRLAEIRMDKRTIIDDVKQRLYLHTGTRPASMRLFLRDASGQTKCELRNENATLGQMGAVTGDSLLLIDEDPYSASANGWLEDTSLVPKYVMPDDVYDKKENTYRKFKAKMRKKDPNWSMTSALAKRVNAENGGRGVDYGEEEPAVKCGDRVEVFPGGKRGEVKYVGKDLSDLPEGWWVGICYDEPVGKNDGCVKGVRYFEAQMGYGALVRPSNVTVGDFAPLDDDLFDESEDEI